ncbi:MAG: sugar phosphate isomerase/epimerase [Bacteroidetes bacterium]|nr:sugar phosphate isomerase/epimerase [Bacteroidota bacterium]MCL5025453.1 sugar phosphate isomerase/epimerase [Chloroflexota bacterium]
MPARFAIASSAIGGDASRLSELLVPGISQVELGFFRPEDRPLLRAFLLANGLPFGIHDPLVKEADFAWPRFTGPDEGERQRSLRHLERSMVVAAEWGAGYVVVHLPSVMLPGTPEQSEARTWEMARRSGEAFSALSERYGTHILIEDVGPNPNFQTSAHYRKFLTEFPSLRFCLDIGHLKLLAIRTGIDPLEFAGDLAPLTATLHLYSARLPEYNEFHHVAAHPSLRPEDGWADVPAILKAVLSGNPDCLVVFEHNLYYPGGAPFAAEGMAWVQCLLREWEKSRAVGPKR